MVTSHAVVTRPKAGIKRALPLVAIFCFLFPSWMAAVDPHTLLSQYGHTAWRAQDGFVSNPTAITQTTDGYIWIATDGGLFRFDGVKFRRWTPPNGQSLPSGGTLNCVLGARDGSLWIGTSIGLARWKDGRLTNYPATAGTPGIYAILEDHAGNIWVTRYRVQNWTGSLCQVKENALECYGKKEGNPALYGLGLTEDAQGDIWFGGITAYRWHQGSFTTYSNAQGNHSASDVVVDVMAAPSGELWAAYDGTGPKSGVQHFSDGKWASYIVPGFDGRTVRSSTFLVDKGQTLWVGSNSNGLYRIHDGTADRYGSSDGLSGDHVLAFYEDREGNLWVGTDGGIDRFRDNAVIDYSKAQGLAGDVISSVFAVKDDAVWVSGEECLSVVQAKPFSPVRRQMVPGHNVSAIFVDSKGQIRLGIDNKVFAYKNGQYIEVGKPDGAALGQIGHSLAFAEDTEGNLWVLTHAHINRPDERADLIRISDQRVRQQYRLEDLTSTSMAADRKSGIWVAARGQLTHYIDGKAQESVQLNHADPFTIRVDSHNAVWAATSYGLLRWGDGQLTTMGETSGLPCAEIYASIQDDQGSNWLGTECGILRITGDEWERWVKSPKSKVSFVLFDALDGVRWSEDDATDERKTKSRDGRLWFNAGTSVLMVDPRRPTNLIPPPVHIEEVVADHKNYELSDEVALPHLRGELEIDYTALSFTIPQRVLFRYKLEGHDEDWQEAGTRREAFYNNLPPKKYRFRVIACNNDGVWNDTGASLDFSVLPAYYQTGWFRALCGAAFLLLLWFIYQYRLRQLRHEFNIGLEAQVKERTRVARELHDTLLQSFQGAAFQFQAARKLLLRNADNTMQVIDEAIHAAEEGITEGRAAIRDLRPEPAAQRNLADLLSAACRELATAQELNGHAPSYQLLVEGEQRDLAPMFHGEVYQISREVIRNAFAHAVASHIEVEIRYDQDQLRVRIRDDGKGIVAKVLADGGQPGHWGISGMRERAQRIGSRLEFWSEVGAGTEVQLTIPAAMAYEKRRHNRRFRLFHRAGSDE